MLMEASAELAHRRSDLIKAAARDSARAVAQRTNELVSADPDKRVKAQMLLDRAGDIAQQRVAGAMTLAVVDLLEPVDIDVGEHQVSVSVASSISRSSSSNSISWPNAPVS
jgi:type IV secretory pathway TrbF-like protein